jgi:hypothetical protein
MAKNSALTLESGFEVQDPKSQIREENIAQNKNNKILAKKSCG